ncbi:MAG: epsG [Polaromonas sp.]|nr:epsG [Polaromonas sp.]
MNRNTPQMIRSVPLTVPSKPATGSGRSMGMILVDAGRLTPLEAERIAEFQQGADSRFGDAGRALRLLTDDDVRYALSVQFGYPYLPSDSNLSRELVAAYQPASRSVEQLRALRSQLMLRWFGTGADRRGLAIVSAGPGEGRSYIAANLAIVFSQLGERTLLVDADMRSPRQHHLFNLGKHAGLSDMLAGRAGAEAVVGIGALQDLSVLPAGAIPPNPQELLGRQDFSRLLQSLGEDFSIIIIDTPPASHCADAHTVAVRAGAALMVARQDRSSVPEMSQFTHGLREFGVTLEGSVLNDARPAERALRKACAGRAVARLKASPEWRQRWALLLQKIQRIHDPDEGRRLLRFLSDPKRPFVLAFANAHAMNSLAASSSFFDALHAADMVLRDGSGMATLFRLQHMKPGLNLNGTDLIPELVRYFDGSCIAVFGTQNPYLQRGVDVLASQVAPRSRYISAHGFMGVGAYAELAAKHAPSLIVLGMGMPRQEQVAAALRSQLKFPCLIVCGGAIVDFLGGRTPRAPAWMRRAGLEWLFRLGLEPRRLFGRYVLGNPLFLARAVRMIGR